METLETERQRVEEKVRKLSSAVEQSIDGIAIGDLEPKLTYVNSAFAWMHGYSPEEMVGIQVANLHNEEQMDEYQRSMDQIKTQGSWIGEIGHVRKDGTPFLTFMSATLLKDDDGKPTGILAVVRHITERKRSEEALQESEENLKTLLENAPDGVYLNDLQGKFLYGNQKAEEIVGYKREELIGKDFLELNLLPQEKLATATKLLDLNAVGKATGPDKFELIRKNGSRVVVEITTTSIKQRGEAVVVGFVRNITERKQVEEELRKSEASYKELADSITDVFFAMDEKLRYTYWNKASEELTGISAKDAVGKSLYDIFADADVEGMRKAEEMYIRALRTKQSQHFTNQFQLGGKEYFFEINAYPTEDGVSVFVKDITEHRRVEETLRESERNYRVLFESMIDGVFVIDAETMKIVLANERVAKMYGFDSIEEVYEANLLDYIHPEDRGRVIKTMAEDMFEKDLRQVNEFRTITKDGRETWVAAVGTRIEYRGRLAGLVSFRDITEHKRMEEMLRASERRYRLLAENVTDVITCVDMNLRPTYMSPSITSLLGYSVEEAMARGIEESLTPASTEAVTEAFATEMALERDKRKDRFKQRARELEFYRKDGSTVWAEVMVSFLRDSEGRPVEIVSVLRNISERRRVEEALRESEHNYRVLFESTIDGMAVIDAETTKVVLANQAAARMAGFDSAEDIIGMNPLDSIPPEDRERVIKVMAEDMFEKDLRQANEYRAITKDVREIWVSAVGTRIEYRGRLAGLVSFRDITKQKRAEEALRESEQRYRLLAENVTDLIWITDMNLRPIYLSPSITRLLGYSVEEGMSLPVEKSLTLASLEITGKSFAKALTVKDKEQEEQLRSQPLEVEMYRKDGSTVWVEVTISFLRDKDGQPVGLLGVDRDITDRKKAEEQLRTVVAQTERMNATTTLAAGVAHELNNPMMGMLNFAQYCLQHTSEDDRRYPVLQNIEHETRRCIDIVDNLLTFSRTGREGEEEYEKGSLATVIDRVVRLLSYRIEREHVAVTHHIAEGTPEIWMKVNSMQQVFLNLMNNALDALKDSQKKEIQVEVHGEGDFVQVTVADSGCGIAPENLGKIFTPFFTTKLTGQGTGLGLSISESIIREHGGRITCESKLGAGTRFRILLPIERKMRRETAR